jgi:hypothetical protein
MVPACCPWSHGLRLKKLSASVAVTPAPSNGHLPRMSWQSHLSANDKGDNEMIPGVVHRSHAIYLIAEENPGKSQLGGRR